MTDPIASHIMGMEGKKMDYKELIEQLRELLPPKVDYAEMVGAEAVHYGKSFVYEDPESYIIEAAATAIETLLAEREAAVDELRGVCKFCKHSPSSFRKDACYDCGGDNHNWQWRGPTPPDRDRTER